MLRFAAHRALQTSCVRVTLQEAPRVSASPSRFRTAHFSTTRTSRVLATSPTSAADRMRAILIKEGKGPAENLYLGEEPAPEPKEGEVQVKVKCFGLNRMDIIQRKGNYPLPPAASETILGVEFSGTVSKLGQGVDEFKEGDAVFGLTYGGAYAEYATTSAQLLLSKPESVSWQIAAGILENYLTAYQALFVEGNMRKGQNVLVHAGASGVGTAAIQLALQVGHADKVFTTCGSDEKVAFLKKLVDNDERLHVINYKTQNFEEEILKITEGVDHVVEFIGRNYFQQNLNVMRRDATMVFLAVMSGPKLPEGVDITRLLYQRLTLKGSTLRSRDRQYQADLMRRFQEHALPLISDGKVKVEVHEVFDWKKVQDAHKEMEANKNSGKIVLEITD